MYGVVDSLLLLVGGVVGLWSELVYVVDDCFRLALPIFGLQICIKSGFWDSLVV